MSDRKHTPDASEDIAPTGECNWCSREAPLRQILDATVEGVYYRWGYYLCRWHQAADTRRVGRALWPVTPPDAKAKGQP